jgi:Flp pilus assembly protein TadG
MRSFREFSDDSGQVVILAAVCMVVIIAFIGLAVDVGHIRYVKRQLQAAADAAALAAAMEVRYCGDTAGCTAMQAAAQAALAENGFANATFGSNSKSCASAVGNPLALTINNPPCYEGAKDPNALPTKLNYVEAVVSDQVDTYFARIVGFDHISIIARAEAARGLGGPCIYALDPSGPGAINVPVALGLVFSCGIVDESISPSAITCLVGLLISAPSISVTGGTTGLLCNSTPPATTGVPVPTPADPLAYLPAPSNANAPCGTSSGPPYSGSQVPVNIVLGTLGQIVFNPGVYCGGISITAGVLTDITFNPGVYVLRNGRGSFLGIPTQVQSGLTITVSALSSITGQGVMFYNEGNAGGFSVNVPSILGLSSFSLTAPTSGEYGGVLFFQAHGVTNTGVFLADLLSGSVLSGVVYEPDAQVTYGVSAIAAASNGVVAKDIQFTVGLLSAFGAGAATEQSGSPFGGDRAALVQ